MLFLQHSEEFPSHHVSAPKSTPIAVRLVINFNLPSPRAFKTNPESQFQCTDPDETIESALHFAKGNDLAARAEELIKGHPRKGFLRRGIGPVQFFVQRAEAGVRLQSQRALANPHQWRYGVHHVQDRGLFGSSD